MPDAYTVGRELSARNLRRHGMRRGAYDGATKRRFVLFVDEGATEWRHEFDTKAERDAYALRSLARIQDAQERKRTRLELHRAHVGEHLPSGTLAEDAIQDLEAK